MGCARRRTLIPPDARYWNAQAGDKSDVSIVARGLVFDATGPAMRVLTIGAADITDGIFEGS